MARIHWSTKAEQDVVALGQRIALTNPASAAREIARIYQTVSRLQSFPRSGRVVPEYGLADFRELIVQRYRILNYCSVDDEEVVIVTVEDASRDLPRHLGRSPLA